MFSFDLVLLCFVLICCFDLLFGFVFFFFFGFKFLDAFCFVYLFSFVFFWLCFFLIFSQLFSLFSHLSYFLPRFPRHVLRGREETFAYFAVLLKS